MSRLRSGSWGGLRSVLIVWLFWSAAAHAGDTAGHGSGPAEKNLIFAHTDLPKYIGFCLSSNVCKLTGPERTLLHSILAAHPAEGAADTQLEFRSEKNQPGFFLIDEKERVAKTGERVGDKIYVNTDLLYSTGTDGLTKPFSVAEAVALLIHEFGHHQGIRFHGSLDLLGSKVQNVLLMQTQELRGGPEWEGIGIIAIVPPNVNQVSKTAEITQFLASDETKVLDFTSQIRKALSCRHASVRNVHLWNLHWTGGRDFLPVLGNDGISRIERVVQGRLSLICERGGAVLLDEQQYDVQIRLSFERRSLSNKPKLLPQVKVTQITCGEMPGRCH